MSEENKTEKKCYKKLLIAGVILSLVLSITSTAMSAVTLLAINGHIPSLAAGQDLPISKKYDRGRSLQKALKKNKPVIVWFYVDWCGYCQRFAPIFDEVTKNKDIKKKFAIAFVNCDDQKNQALVQKYQIHGFPTVYLLDPKTGEKVVADNYKFFTPTAKEDLVRDFKEFLRPKK